MPQSLDQKDINRALKRLGRNIKVARIDRDNLPQDVLARDADIERSHLGKIESGSHNPSLKTLLKIAAALDMPVRDLLQGDGFD
jgi:DNA-binding XRE family transcriptional regulator